MDGTTPMTPLMAAVQQINIDIVQFLLFAKAKVNGLKTPGTTPLRLAAQTGSADVVELLCQQLADVHSVADTGRVALFEPI